eukprot:CAMPEP_0180305958 /NCGR_PEP_ID=MMETSP0988-20121125/26725_1 /TAXON_ID=697907 /ORGANISM="non described non described, Strain CCMP2293" /LENGTH=97 /DNA_ID=CAMNT_0022288469 /DNA_START=1 /DNA_END=294 /DNA_ORIENTATION=-
MGSSLDSISEGLGRLRGIAIDMHSEVQVQHVMLDEIADKADSAQHQLLGTNRRLTDVLERAGGGAQVWVNILLVVLLLSLLAYIYTTLHNRDAPTTN